MYIFKGPNIFCMAAVWFKNFWLHFVEKFIYKDPACSNEIYITLTVLILQIIFEAISRIQSSRTLKYLLLTLWFWILFQKQPAYWQIFSCIQ
jgi:hypothetical protein